MQRCLSTDGLLILVTELPRFLSLVVVPPLGGWQQRNVAPFEFFYMFWMVGEGNEWLLGRRFLFTRRNFPGIPAHNRLILVSRFVHILYIVCAFNACAYPFSTRACFQIR